jgi:hypothetical protein
MSDMDLFVGASAALTGISQDQLAPDLDPLNVKQQYFDQAKTDPNLPALLQFFAARQSEPPDQVAQEILANPTIAPLARAIMLEWYTGSWYAPSTLVKPPDDPKQQAPPVNVISSDAYTQGWMWNVAQAHPMGYSNWRFGYWSSPPPALTDFTTGGS